MKPKTKVRDKVKNGTEKLRKTTKKLNSQIMEKVKIKRVKRIKKKTTTGEKILAAVGLGSTLIGGVGSVSSQSKNTQFVRTQANEAGSKTQGFKNLLKDIFGVKSAKASSSVSAAQQALAAAQSALSGFDAWVASATADIPLFAPEDRAQRQQEIDAEVASTRPGLVQAVAAAQAEYDQAVSDAQGPQEGQTKTENGLTYTFYQGGWVLNNGQTKTEGGFTYGSEGGSWILLDGQTKTENGITYISSGGQWVQQSTPTQGPQIGETRTGSDGFQYVFSNSIYPTGAWTLVDGQTKTENGQTYKVQGGTWVLQQTGPQEGQTKTENGLSYHFTGGQWVDDAGNRVQNPNSFWYIADGNGGWTLADGQTKTENGVTYQSQGGQWVEQVTQPQEGQTKTENGLTYTFYQGGWVLNNGQTKTENGISYGSQGGVWILLDGQTKTENGITYISSGGQWVEKPAGVEAPKIGDVQKGSDGYDYVFSNSIYPTGAWTLVDGQTKTENGQTYKVQGGTWVLQQTGPQEGQTKTENGLSYHFTGGQWVDDAGNRVQNPNSFWYIADGNGNWTLEDNQTKTENGKNYKSQGGSWIEVAGNAATGTTIAQVIAKAQASAWGDLSAEEQQMFSDYFANGQHASEIPASFSSGSTFAFALGLGSKQEGDVMGFNGVSYKLQGGTWVLQTPENTPRVNYEVWRTDLGVGAYYNEQYGFVTLTTDGRLIDQNGNLITEPIAGNYQLQGLMFQLHAADVGNTVKNPEYKPVVVAGLTGQSLIDQANNGSVNWNNLTPAQQQELANHYANHPELLPQAITPGSPLAYMLGLGASTDANDPTVLANAQKAGLEFKNGQWVKVAANPTGATTPSVTFTTNSGNTATPKVGDTWTITITGPVGAPVFSSANGSTTQMGVIGPDGKLVLTGTFKAGDVGTWNQTWTVGEGTAQVSAGKIDFKLVAASSSELQQTAPFGQDTLSFTVKDNGNGTFSIIYNGQVLVTGKTVADIEAARAKYPFMYATPEAAVLSMVSRNFNNYFLTTGSQLKLDNGTRTTVSTTENREVYRDGNGNAAAYFTEFGGRIYFDKATGNLYREDKDGNYVKMDLGEISPETRQNIINALTGSGANIKVTTVTHNLMSELGQTVKGANLKQDPKDGNWYVTDDKGNFVLDANGKRIQANLQRYVWSPGGWSSWGYNTEGLNEEMAKYASKQYTVDVVTAPNGIKTYTLTVTLPDGKPTSRTFMSAAEFNNFLVTGFTTSNAFMDMSPQDKAIFMAATDARIHFPELTAAFIGNTPAASTNHRIIWRNPNNGLLEVQGMINPTYMSTYQQAQALQSLFPGSQIKERLPLSWPGVMAYEYDPSDPRRVFEVILSDGTVLNVSNAMNSLTLEGQTLTVMAFPQNVINQLKPPAGVTVNAKFVGGVGYGSPEDNARAANGLVEPGSFGPSANPTYSGAIVPMQWLNLGNGQGGFVDPASPYTINQQNGLNPNQGVVNTGVTPTTVTTTTTTLMNNLFTLPINTSGGSVIGGATGGSTGNTGAGTGASAQQTAPMPSITRLSSTTLKAGGTVQITGQNFAKDTTLVELVNKSGKVVGLTVNSVSGSSITATLPQTGLESGEYTLQLRYVGTGANFGKISNGLSVTVQGSAATTTTASPGVQASQTLAVGANLGTSVVTGGQTSLSNVAVFASGDVNTQGKVSPGNVIELGGQGLSGYDKFGLVVNGQEYEVKKFSVSDSSIKLTVPTNLPASIPAGANVQVKLYSSGSSAAQGVLQQTLTYGNTAVQDNQTTSEEPEVESSVDEADTVETSEEAEVESEEDVENDIVSGVGETANDEVEAGTDAEAEITGPAADNLHVSNTAANSPVLASAKIETDSDEVEADDAEEPALAPASAQAVTQTVTVQSTASAGNSSSGSTAGSGQTANSGGSVQIRGGASGIRGTVTTLGAADQSWSGGLKMPAGYPASGGLQMPESVSADQSASGQQGAVYKVKKGDTLWAIAKKNYGDGKKWRKILEANLDKVKDPKQLKVGAELVIPKI